MRTCAGRIMRPRAWHSVACPYSASLNEQDTWWCRRHAPSLAARRREAGRAAWERQKADRKAVE